MAVITDKYASTSTLTITLASLASSSAGVGRQSTLVDNTTNLFTSAQISVKITVGTTPVLNSLISVYLLRSDNSGTPVSDDGAGASDAGLSVINAPLLGTIVVNSVTSNLSYYGVFDTKFLGSLGPKWGIAVVNNSGVALNATAGNFIAEFNGITQSVL